MLYYIRYTFHIPAEFQIIFVTICIHDVIVYIAREFGQGVNQNIYEFLYFIYRSE